MAYPLEALLRPGYDSVAPSQVDRIHRSGVDMARAVAEGLTYRSGRSGFSAVDQLVGQLLEAHL